MVGILFAGRGRGRVVVDHPTGPNDISTAARLGRKSVGKNIEIKNRL